MRLLVSSGQTFCIIRIDQTNVPFWTGNSPATTSSRRGGSRTIRSCLTALQSVWTVANRHSRFGYCSQSFSPITRPRQEQNLPAADTPHDRVQFVTLVARNRVGNDGGGDSRLRDRNSLHDDARQLLGSGITLWFKFSIWVLFASCYPDEGSIEPKHSNAARYVNVQFG